MSKGMKIFIYILTSILTILLAGFLFVYFSAYPTTWVIRKAFSETSYTKHPEFEELSKNIIVDKNIKFDSKFKNNKLDIIYPKDANNLPTILWIHGGAFVAGDKDDVLDYLIVLANEGYTIVNINYELSPKLKYPNHLKQISDAYNHIAKSDYKQINLDKIIIGGDSAGAHMAAQFINIQVNDDYSKLVGINPVIEKDTIISSILFAGPYDFDSLANLVKNKEHGLANVLFKFIAKRIGYAYLGKFNWQNKDFKELTIMDYVTSNFPSTFITDGNTFSFEDHARLLESKLLEKNVHVKSVYYEDELMHEYQFNLGTFDDKNFNHAQNTFDELIIYLKQL